MRETAMGPASRASLLESHVNSAPRQVCLSAHGGHLDGRGGIARILGILRNYFAPEAAHAIDQQVARFLQYRRTEQSIGEVIDEFDLLQ